MSDPVFPAPVDLARAGNLSSAVSRYAALIAGPAPVSPEENLRLRRHRAWLNSAVPALIGDRSAADVCADWSRAADDMLRENFLSLFPADCALFALGKLGSRELNLSSDVDIVVVSASGDPAALAAVRKFQKLFSDSGPWGFALRTDFDLRPGGRQGPLIPTVDQFVDYYGNYGETWERMAFVRLRPIAGDPTVIKNVTDFAARFSYRKHLDYGLLEDLKNLRSKIHAEHWKRSADGFFDLKLGVGGIRDVELFFHALQVIHGGKDPSLRVAGTTEAAHRLSTLQLLPKHDADFLLAHYWSLRALENFVQALGDEQTHRLDPNTELPEFLRDDRRDLREKMETCNRLVSTLLGEPPAAPSEDEIKARAHDPERLRHLEEAFDIPVLSRNKDRDEATRRAFLEKFLHVLREQNADTAMALEQLKDFLRATRAKASFFTLLLREEKLLRELAWIFGHSRYLGRLLCYRPELLDAFVFRAQDLTSGDFEVLLEQLVEKRLLAEIIEGGRFLRDLDLAKANAALTSVADGIVGALATAIAREHPTDIRVLALGKWGAFEMGFRSDLDFIFVSPQEATDADHRFARRMISRLTEPHRGGSIYPIDLRLRPSGKAGPIVMPATDLQKYLRDDAAAWERQAYFRARWIGEPLFDLRAEVFARALTAENLRELNRIRGELLPKDGHLDLKYSEGGLVDIELCAQTLALLKTGPRSPASTLLLLQNQGHPELAQIYAELRQCEQAIQLTGASGWDDLSKNPEELQLLAALLKKANPLMLENDLRRALEQSRDLLGRLDPRRTAG